MAKECAECGGGRQGRSAARGAPTPHACDSLYTRAAEDRCPTRPAGAAGAPSLQLLGQHLVPSRFLTSRFHNTSPPRSFTRVLLNQVRAALCRESCLNKRSFFVARI